MASSQNDVVKSLSVGASILEAVSDFLSSKKSLSDNDYSRYSDMTTAYGRYISPKDNACPKLWELDNKRKPLYSITLKDAKENIERDMKKFNDQSLNGEELMVKTWPLKL